MSGDAEDRIRADRIAKVEAMRAAGVDPYPARTPPRAPVEEVRTRFGTIEAGAETGESLALAGRIAARRGHGKAMFLDLADRTGRLQLHATVDVLGEEAYGRLAETDLGDVIAAEGDVFASRRGELTLRVHRWAMLAKCLRPLPEKWHGLSDVELRHRHRYLDLIVNEDSRRVALARSRLVTAIRAVLDGDGFVEVETPILQPIYGGAAARPFTTYYNEFERDFYLRIADELYLKRLIVGGLERVYEIAKDFRNEGVSFKANPEFTMLEWYEAYADFAAAMDRVELVVAAAGAAAGCERDLSPPWERRPLREAIMDHAGIDPMADRNRDRLVAFMRERGIDTSADRTWAHAVDHLLSSFVEPELERPTFLTHYPIELSPFAKRSPDDPELVERFEVFCAGMEIANGYTELNDPADQRARFEEAGQVDEDYVRALEYGMPPTAGVGIGIDRLTMVITGARSIREVILFPTLRERA
ncbi:MAG TPA: lysine--tRNA ligase [Gaiellales bacterium]|nr:lysine--tRNA ligase [Gaiellales bacterium]